MNEPEKPIGKPSRPESDQEICLRHLSELANQPERCLAPGSPDAEVWQSASLLLRRIKAARKKASKQRDQEIREQSPIRSKRTNKTWGRYHNTQDEQRDEPLELDRPRHCYICKNMFTRLHPFYDAMCQECGEFNFAKRGQLADLSQRRALVTGGRIKIGFQIALKLLRAGAHVAITTRFPFDALQRYSMEDDFRDWSSRLLVYAADFRYLPMVSQLCSAIKQDHATLNILVNNAAQTVRRPPEYYEHLLEIERDLSTKLPEPLKQLVRIAPSEQDNKAQYKSLGKQPDSDLSDQKQASGPESVHIAAMMSQVRLLESDGQHGHRMFPLGKTDFDGQQIDKRSENSWIMELADVSIPELLEVHAVNSLAPFMLVKELLPLMRNSKWSDRYVVNVSAVEGQFGVASKTGLHPHTNMAKASMNMMTRTSAKRLAKENIFMTSVDTGWVTNEFPLPKTEQMKSEGFEPPLDEIDGASRVCDPVFVGVNEKNYLFGKFLKDYREAPW